MTTRSPVPGLAELGDLHDDVQVMPTSAAQRRFWLLDQLEPEAAAYTIPVAVRLSGALDIEALRSALDLIVSRHESLRTTFVLEDEALVQVISPPRHVDLALEDLSTLSPGDQDAALRERLAAWANLPFDLARGPLFRVALTRLDERTHLLRLALHHAIADGWSIGILHRELEQSYSDIVAGRGSSLPPLALQYADYAVWQEQMLESAPSARQLAWWQERLSAPRPVLELPTDRARPAVQSTRGSKREGVIPADLLEAVRALGRRHGATPYVTFLAAYFAFLHRYSRQDDLIVGSITAGRGRPELEPLIGLFVNTLALRVDAGGDPSFVTLLERVREATTDAMAHDAIPFEEIVESLGAGRDRSRSPIFQAAFQLLEGVAPELRLPGIVAETVRITKESTKFDLTLMLNGASDGALRCVIEYSTDLFDASTIDAMIRQFTALLSSIIREPTTPIDRLALMAPADEARVTEEWNATASPLPAWTVPGRVLERAAAHPESIALRSGDTAMPYGDLAARSAKVANHLATLGIGAGDRVGVCMDRTPSLVVALLGVLRSGAAYLPLDPSHPAARLEHVLDDAKVRAVLTDAASVDRIPPGSAPLLAVEAILARDATAEPFAAPTIDPESAAYVIYTSGSTGKPKGVVVPHRALANFLESMAARPGLAAGDALVAVTTVAFDIAGLELWLPLTTGAWVQLASRDVASDGHRLRALVEATTRTAGTARVMMQATPSTWLVLREAGWSGGPNMVMLCGGEAWPAHLAASLLPCGKALWNVYGPTETTIWSSRHQVKNVDDLSLGEPVANTTLLVMEPNGTPAPVGIPGELWIGGAGLATGYHDRPDLTAERFVQHPRFGRLYRTGDRVRRRANGALQYLGRLDDQIKLRGHRIELGEIEAALVQHREVSAAAVLLQEDGAGQHRLIAYCVMVEGATTTPSELRDHLRSLLPEVMVPSAVLLLPTMPLNANGKIDRKALPAPDAQALSDVSRPYVAPRSELEREIADVWAAVLGAERVSISDDFFELGGHSLAAMRILARLHHRLPGALTLATILRARTVEALAAEVATVPAASRVTSIARRPAGCVTPLSWSQQLVWLFEQMSPGLATYNVPMLRRITGPLDVDALHRALNGVVARHEILRTAFRDEGGTPIQVATPATPVEFRQVDLRGQSDPVEAGYALLKEEAARPFDLESGRLLRGALVTTGDSEWLLLLVTHHLAFDGASVGVLMRELTQLYAGEQSHAPLPLQFGDYAAWDRSAEREEAIQRGIGYWREQLRGAPGAIDLPTDRPRPSTTGGPGARHIAMLPAALTTRLEEFARAHDSTLYMVLLAAFQCLLHRYSGQDDLVVGSPIAGRLQRETEELIGYFASTLPMRARFDPDTTFADHLAKVRASSLDAFEHQSVPYERMVLELRGERGEADAALFSVMFVLQDAASPSLRLGDAAVVPAPLDLGIAKFDISLSAAQVAEGVRLSVEYRADLFEAASVVRMMDSFGRLLMVALETPAERITCLPLITQDEQQLTVVEWNRTAELLSDVDRIHLLVEEWAARKPQSVACTGNGPTLTYAELNHRANVVATRLRDLGVTNGAIVALCAPRSAEWAVGALGALKAGAAFLPLDSTLPLARLRYMLEDAAPCAAVTTSALRDLLPSKVAAVLLDELVGEVVEVVVPSNAVASDGPAYVIYTSGSTGRPKGTVLHHRGLCNLGVAAARLLEIRYGTRVLQFASHGFDASVWEFATTLGAGGTLCFASNEVIASADDLIEYINAQQVEVATMPPSLLRILDPASIPSIRTIVSAGEACGRDVITRWAAAVRLVNGYGPTETTVCATAKVFALSDALRPTIGSPLPNVHVYVLDTAMHPQPIGMPGELFIGGVGVGLGYLGKKDLTARSFLPDPFATGHDQLMYRSGDRVRWLPDGTLEYLGRLDHQVKLRGFRIELGEIEAVLSSLDGVQESVAAITDFGIGDPRIVAYFVSDQPEPKIGSLLSQLRLQLPAYMVPSVLHRLDRIPLTPNGKVDRAALPSPNMAGEGDPTVLPRTPLEAQIAGVWATVLGRETVGVEDDFFTIGGHSLLAMRVVSGLAEVLPVRLTIAALFEARTVAALAELVVQRLAAREMAAGADEELAAMLAELETLSPGDAARLLASDSTGST